MGGFTLKRFTELFKKVNGLNVLKQYARAHVLLFALIQTLLNGFSKKSLEIVRLSVNNKILNKLRKKYKHFINEYLEHHKNDDLIQKQSNKVWVCWFQGIENAPMLVQKCYESLNINLVDREIILLTESNYKNYVSFPYYIQNKIDKQIIKGAHLSDLIRLELLIKYGGTWVDSTVFVSDNQYPNYFFDSDFFVFQCLKPGADGKATNISNWFITASSNNKILRLTQALLYEYWKNNNNLIDYFIFHYFFQLAIEVYPEEWEKVIPFSNSTPHILLLRLFKQYDEKKWDSIKTQTSIHKLSYKFSNDDFEKKGTYYDVIINQTF